jgi:hypothetical protein
MSIETALGAHLCTFVALVGNRVHDKRLPQEPTFPALTFQRISTLPLYSHQGYSGYTECRFQISCWAMSQASVRQVAAQVRTALDGYAGLMSADTQVGHCFCIGDRDFYEPETKRFHAPLDFKIAFKE